jgi:hypothetical protein
MLGRPRLPQPQRRSGWLELCMSGCVCMLLAHMLPAHTRHARTTHARENARAQAVLPAGAAPVSVLDAARRGGTRRQRRRGRAAVAGLVLGAGGGLWRRGHDARAPPVFLVGVGQRGCWTRAACASVARVRCLWALRSTTAPLARSCAPSCHVALILTLCDVTHAPHSHTGLA